MIGEPAEQSNLYLDLERDITLEISFLFDCPTTIDAQVVGKSIGKLCSPFPV